MLRAGVWTALLVLLAPPAGISAADARTTPLQTARTVRLQGCHGRAGTRAPLRNVGGLNEAALAMSHGAALNKAIAQSGYRDQQSSALHVSGEPSDLRQAMANQLCAALVDPAFTDLGIAQRGRDAWLIVSVPFAPPSAASASAADDEVLARINAARAQSRRCGSRVLPAAAPLRPNAQLGAAAQAHARDMLDHNYFAHEGRDGSTPAQRVAATGYSYRIVGENLAFGPASAAEAVEGWIASPGHCENLMDSRFVESGVGFAASSYGPARIYWVQEFGSQR